MVYLRVKKSFDNYKRGDGCIHISNELYTLKEAAKYGVNPAFCDKIEISCKKTFFFFGARFEKNIN
jgi:hypothetical protein